MEKLNTSNIIRIFKELSLIPRCSKNENGIANWLIDWAKTHDFEYKRDNVNNIVIKIPASKNKANSSSIALQGHMDMVCEKTQDSKHNFSKDPIEVIEKDGWLKANRTTLGADNGIALAIGLALAEETDIEMPPLELLFTSDEETGLNGAKNLDNNFITSKTLINIDSEQEGTFIIGCAGGEDTDIAMQLNFDNIDKNSQAFTINIYNLLSGHSGIDINKNRANAIKLMDKLLIDISNTTKIRIVNIEGGSARNAIPKSCSATIVVDIELQELKSIVDDFYKAQLIKYPQEKDMRIELTKANTPNIAIIENDTARILSLLNKLPHGVYLSLDNMITNTSNNLAKVYIDNKKLHIHTNQRSLSEDKLDEITGLVESIAKQFEANYSSYNRYPSWQPNHNSEILEKAIDIHKKLFSKKPLIEVIHAGLECGILGAKFDNLDMISIGPTIKDAHTPNERISIESIEHTYLFLVRLLESL